MMDQTSRMEQAQVCVDLDLEYCVILNNNNANEEAGCAGGENQPAFTKSCVISRPDDHLGTTVDPLKANEENMKNSCVMLLIDGKLEEEGGAAGKAGDFIAGKEKRKKAAAASAKKPPKPPQPHRGGGGGFSLDATDQKLIKELAELAMIKRARIERMKALMQKKANSSKINSSSSHLFAMLFIVLVFLVLLFQGMSCQISCGTFRGSPPTTQANESSFIFIQDELNPSAAHDSV